jgi:transcriptional regulator with XRE-family HTH domain
MSIIVDEGARLAERLRSEREARGWSLAELADRSGVSKAMISKVERGESSPTAALLVKLSGALQLTMSALLAEPDRPASRLQRADQQPRWIDPQTHYLRRQVYAGELPVELVEVELPAGAVVEAPASAYRFTGHLIVGLQGELTFVEGDLTHCLRPGDCLQLGPPADCRFENRSRAACRYLVAVIRKAL